MKIAELLDFFWGGGIKGVVFPSSVVGRYSYSNKTPRAILEARSPKSRCQQGLSLLKSMVGLCHAFPLILIAYWQFFFFLVEKKISQLYCLVVLSSGFFISWVLQ